MGYESDVRSEEPDDEEDEQIQKADEKNVTDIHEQQLALQTYGFDRLNGKTIS